MSTATLSLPRQRLGLLAVGALAGVLVASLGGPALLSARAADDDDARERTISVEGTGRVKVIPDVADLSVGVIVQRDRAGDAAADAANEMAKVIESLTAQGIDPLDIQTTQLGLDPVYDYDRSPAQIVGYQASNIVTVTIRDLTTVGAIIDSAVEAGATSVGGLSFRLEDTSGVETQAREDAVAAARGHAETLAGAAGVTIGDVISITETSSPVPMPVYYGEAAARDAAATPIMPGQVEVSVTVYVVYAIA
jgi:hypothetical protein